MKLPLILAMMATLSTTDIAIAGSVDAARQTQLGAMARHSERMRTDTGIQRTTEVVGPHNKSYRREVDISGNGQSRTKQVTLTGADGLTKTREKIVEREASDGVHSRTAIHTGFNGETRTRVDEVARTENGVAATTLVTNANGETYQRDATTTIDKEHQTATTTVVRTNPEGEVHSRSVVRSYSNTQQPEAQAAP